MIRETEQERKVRSVREYAERLRDRRPAWDGRPPIVTVERDVAEALLARARAAEGGDEGAIAEVIAVYDGWEPCPIGSNLRIPPSLYEGTGHATPLPYGGVWPDRD
jgi:hypothetical protein